MKSPIKLGKHVEDPESRDCLDMISSLPDELLGHMLSFLPTRCSVGTSILSTRWRYLFTLATCLSFDDAPCFGDSEVNKEIEGARKGEFKKFVYKVLELHKVSPIEKFSLVCKGSYDESDLYAWVGTAVHKGVQELHYQVGEQDLLPDALFMCETLVRLKMIFYGDYGIEIPLSVRLTRLKILHLEYIRFFDFDAVERLFSGCELLEELTLESCDCESSGNAVVASRLLKVLTLQDCSFVEGLFEIDAPNLAYLTYSSNLGMEIVPSWKNSSTFVKAELSFNYGAEDDCDQDSLQHDRDLLNSAACKTTNLRLICDAFEHLLTRTDHEEMPPFHSLSILHLYYFPYDAWKYVTSLFDRSPQVENVIFEWGLHRCYCDTVSPPNVPLLPFSCHAKVIVVHSFCGHECSLLFLGHLLRNAGVLKRLVVHKCSSVDAAEKLRIDNDLLMLPRASKDCCIELK